MNINEIRHWRVKAKQTAEIREAVFVLARFAKVDRGCAKVRVTLHYRPRDRRRRDALNIVPTLKAAEDGLVDAGVMADDTPEYIDPVMPVIDPPYVGQLRPELWIVVERLA